MKSPYTSHFEVALFFWNRQEKVEQHTEITSVAVRRAEQCGREHRAGLGRGRVTAEPRPGAVPTVNCGPACALQAWGRSARGRCGGRAL